MRKVRKAAVAGRFYPGDATELDTAVGALLAGTGPLPTDGPLPKAIIAPHAGYIFSGAIAARAYGRLRPLAGIIDRVAVIGPCHRLPVQGIALPSADAFCTPLGPIPVDRMACEALLGRPQIGENDAAHEDEHALEVHLPFLQAVLGEIALVPIAVGDCSTDAVVDVMELLSRDPSTLIVVSSDLSHHLDYDRARRMDAATCRAIEDLDPNAISGRQACGRIPVNALLTFARRHQLIATTLDLRNSGDTAGTRRSVVGYGAWAFTERPDPEHV